MASEDFGGWMIDNDESNGVNCPSWQPRKTSEDEWLITMKVKDLAIPIFWMASEVNEFGCNDILNALGSRRIWLYTHKDNKPQCKFIKKLLMCVKKIKMHYNSGSFKKMSKYLYFRCGELLLWKSKMSNPFFSIWKDSYIMYVEFTAFIANILMVLIVSRPNVRWKSIQNNAPKPRGNFGQPICGTPIMGLS